METIEVSKAALDWLRNESARFGGIGGGTYRDAHKCPYCLQGYAYTAPATVLHLAISMGRILANRSNYFASLDPDDSVVCMNDEVVRHANGDPDLNAPRTTDDPYFERVSLDRWLTSYETLHHLHVVGV